MMTELFIVRILFNLAFVDILLVSWFTVPLLWALRALLKSALVCCLCFSRPQVSWMRLKGQLISKALVLALSSDLVAFSILEYSLIFIARDDRCSEFFSEHVAVYFSLLTFLGF